MELENKIIEIVKSNINFQGEILMDSKLKEDLDVDSFGNLMIVNGIEDEFSIKVEDEDLSSIKTIRDIVEIVRKHIK